MQCWKYQVNMSSGMSRLCGNVTLALQLADGQSWGLYFTEGLEVWGDSLASLMRLKRAPSDDKNSLIFVHAPQREDVVCPVVSQTGCSAMPDLGNQVWRVHDLGPVRIWHTDGPSGKVIELLYLSDRKLQIISMFFSLIPIHHAVMANGGLPFHAALVTRNGAGVLIAAPGDGGKSTCAARIPNPWEALCDDQAVIVRDNSGRYAAHPFPTWSDHMSGRSNRTWDVQRHVPLKALFFLEQSREDTVLEIPKTLAAARAYNAAEQVSTHTWRGLDAAEVRAFRNKLFENACELVKTVPTYILRASLTGKFWEEMERVLSV